jgi:hypothetical protein
VKTLYEGTQSVRGKRSVCRNAVCLWERYLYGSVHRQDPTIFTRKTSIRVNLNCSHAVQQSVLKCRWGECCSAECRGAILRGNAVLHAGKQLRSQVLLS